MRIAQIRRYDAANGPGIRATLFVSGCTHNCKGCFNSIAQDFNYGSLYTDDIKKQFISYCKDDKVTGVSILGGEPMQQSKELLELLKDIRATVNKPIWLWSGYTYEEIIKDNYKKQFLDYIDVLIDGKFEEANKNLMIKYRGSSNQRVINVKDTLNKGKIIQYSLNL